MVNGINIIAIDLVFKCANYFSYIEYCLNNKVKLNSSIMVMLKTVNGLMIYNLDMIFIYIIKDQCMSVLKCETIK